jgi:type I restriction enzyme S subunit
MASEWRTSIGALCDAGVAHLQTGPFGSQLHAYDYVDDGVPVVPTEAIRGRRIDHSVLPKITEAKAQELERHRLQPGDILFARRGVQATGHVGCVRDAEDGFICGTGAIRLRITRANAEVDPDYLSHVLADPSSVEWFKFHAIGATMPNLNEGIIRAFPLSLPPLPEQRAIAHMLGTLDDKIELNRRMNETLEAMARALFKSWFVDFDPVRAKAEGRDPGLPKPIADLFPGRLVDSELGEIPAGWGVRPIGDLAEVVGGSTPKTERFEYWENGTHHWVTPKDLSGLSMPVLLDTERRITDAGLAQIGSGLLPIGTVLLSSRAPIGYLAVAEILVAINQGFIAMKPRSGISNLFLLRWASAAHDEIVSHANGSTFLEISKSSFRPIRTVAPTTPVMHAFDRMSRPMYLKVVEHEREYRTLAVLRDTRLPRLVSGELRVKDAENFIGRAV